MKTGGSYLALGVFYANTGLINEAESEFQKLLKKTLSQQYPPNCLGVFVPYNDPKSALISAKWEKKSTHRYAARLIKFNMLVGIREGAQHCGRVEGVSGKCQNPDVDHCDDKRLIKNEPAVS